ncbi:MAG: cobyrinate a,c-diamide synthase, partial [Nitrospinota bacterium]
GTHSGVGKTTIAIGLMAALRKRGMTVQPFKVGPDYIDPSFHRMICGRPSYNLDTWMMGNRGVKNTFAKAMKIIPPRPPLPKGGWGDFQVGIIEGVMGFFDGKGGRDEEGSTAHIAKVLKMPVILVVDASAMARSAGALVYGYEKFDPMVKIRGVIFNRVGSERHFYMLKQAIEDRCNAKVLGYIPRDEEISLPERHLGLVMAGDRVVSGQWSVVSKRLVSLIERFVDIKVILRIADCGLRIADSKSKIQRPIHWMGAPKSEIIRIAVAMDDAFCFYYQENLDILKELGAKLVFFSPLKDKRLPKGIKGIYLGGGYPELYAKRLSVNKSLAREIKDLAERNIPIYAECGGLMYLGKGLKDLKDRRYDMVGLFSYISKMTKKRMVLGYREVIATKDCPFMDKGEKIRGHEFHYSNIDEPSNKIKKVYQLTNPPTPPFRKGGKKGGLEGYLYKNTLSSYIHLHFGSNPEFAKGFIEKCRRL